MPLFLALPLACQPKGETRYQATGSARPSGSGDATASSPSSATGTGASDGTKSGSSTTTGTGTDTETATGEDDDEDADVADLDSATGSSTATNGGDEIFAEDEGTATLGEDDAASAFAAERVATIRPDTLPTLESCQADGKAWLPGRPMCGDALVTWCCSRDGVLARFPSRASDLASRIDAAATAGLKLFQCSIADGVTTLHFGRMSGAHVGWRRLRVAAPDSGVATPGSCVLVGSPELRDP
jgi:hypothetical protein